MAFLLNPMLLRLAVPSRGMDVREFAEASGQSFKKGEFVFFATAGGGLTVWATEGTHPMLGIANEDASGTAGTMIEVTVLHTGDWLRMKYSGTAPKRMMKYGNVVSSNVHYLDTTEVTNTYFVVQEDPDTTNTKVDVTLLAAVAQADFGI